MDVVVAGEGWIPHSAPIAEFVQLAALRAGGESSVILLTSPCSSTLRHLLKGEGACSRMTELSRTARPCAQSRAPTVRQSEPGQLLRHLSIDTCPGQRGHQLRPLFCVPGHAQPFRRNKTPADSQTSGYTSSYKTNQGGVLSLRPGYTDSLLCPLHLPLHLFSKVRLHQRIQSNQV